MANLILASGIIGLPIASLDEEEKIAVARDVLIDMENRSFVGVTVRRSFFSPLEILSGQDILSIDSQGIVTKTRENIVPAKEIVRAEKSRKFNLLGSRVKTTNHHYLGKIADVAISLDSFTAVSLYVRFLWKERIISADKITAIKNRTIIIQDNWEMVREANYG